MTTDLHLRTEFDVGARACLILMSDPELHEELGRLKGIAHREMRNMRVENGVRTWQVEVALFEKAPAFIRDLLPGEQLRWVQKFRLDQETLAITISVEHPLPDKALHVDGEGGIVELEPGERSALDMVIHISSGLPLIGKRLEKLLADRLKTMMEVDFEIRRTYLKRNRNRLEALKKRLDLDT